MRKLHLMPARKVKTNAGERWGGYLSPRQFPHLKALVEAGFVVSRVVPWMSYCKEKADEPGLASLHRHAKGRLPWPTFLKHRLSGAPLPPQDDAKLRAESWHTLWDADAEPEELIWPPFTPQMLEDIRWPDYFEFGRLCKSFPAKTGIGACGLSPRHFAFLSQGAFQTILLLWVALLRFAAFLAEINLLSIRLIPKAAGGERPIGLFPTMTRLLARWLRRTYGEIWAASQRRPFFYSICGASSAMVAWRSAVFVEYGKIVGREVWLVMLDLLRAFENVSHVDLIIVANRYGFNPLVLWLLFALHRMPRRICIRTVVARSVQASKTVVPGDAFSDILLRLVLLRTLDAAAASFSETHIVVVVDDIQLLGIQRPGDEDIRGKVGQAARFIIEAGFGEERSWRSLHQGNLTFGLFDFCCTLHSICNVFSQKMATEISINLTCHTVLHYIQLI